MLVIFPFEEAIYREAGVPVEWVGHPLLDVMPPPRPRRATSAEELGLRSDATGRRAPAGQPRATRSREILPDLVEAARLIRARLPGGAVRRRARAAPGRSLFAAARRAGARRRRSSKAAPTTCSAGADVALVASGTVTVQAALHECPMVVVYRLSPLTYRLGKPFVRVDTYRDGQPRRRPARRAGADPGRRSRRKRSPTKRCAC